MLPMKPRQVTSPKLVADVDCAVHMGSLTSRLTAKMMRGNEGKYESEKKSILATAGKRLATAQAIIIVKT